MFRSQSVPSCPEYADPYNRLRSFVVQHLPSGQTAEMLANAGFFYVGKLAGIVQTLYWILFCCCVFLNSNIIRIVVAVHLCRNKEST